MLGDFFLLLNKIFLLPIKKKKKTTNVLRGLLDWYNSFWAKLLINKSEVYFSPNTQASVQDR